MGTLAPFHVQEHKLRHKYLITYFVVDPNLLHLSYYGILPGENVRVMILDGVEVAVARLAKGSRSVVAIALCPN